MNKQIAVCGECGSGDVCAFPSCEWDVDSQDWIVTGDIDNGLSYCSECDTSDAQINLEDVKATE